MKHMRGSERPSRRSLVPVLAVSIALALSGAAPAQEGPGVTIVLPQVPNSVDPCETSASFASRVVKNNVAEGLTELNTVTNSVEPRLATSWERVDPLTWRFHLREGVTFHDGEAFDAEAVAFSIQRTMLPDLACRVRAKFFSDIEFSTNVVDALTIDISTNDEQPILPMLMTHVMMASPNSSLTEKGEGAIGTGPYIMQTWDPSQHIVLTRNDSYWGGQPEIATATYVWRTDPAVAAAMVAAGEADIAYEIAPQDATNPETDFSYLNFETVRMRFGMDQPPLDDLRVRQALKFGVDRDAFIGTVLPADTLPATQLVVPSVLGYNDGLELWPYDPDQARALIEEARADGVPVDREIRLLTRHNLFPSSTEVLEGLTQMWADIGLNVQILVVEAAQKTALDSRPFDPDRPPTISADQHDNASGDAALTFPYKYSSWGNQSDVDGYPELDELIRQALVAEGEERAALFQEGFRLVADDIVPDVVLFHMVGYTRFGPRIEFDREQMNSNELQLARLSIID